ncbi:hypothetical protein CDL12_22849 [Handroanthus impetiginosus]|uniref:VQ domain-containing protein n=1 Tax=Handroanthus impetiginosus TaxID=429701 RepID=A0A2G9GH49_9LAMI|nr:hypothetical protein CDL12_22849 [Handroanthus impetiginosus]
MAISEPMSSNHSNWMQFYQTNFPEINQTEVPPSTTITTTVATTTNTTAATISTNNNLSIDQGRISKPIRRRSRASRRTPTTLVNTDTTNFRAMVQQFTGGPHATSTAALQLPNTVSFGQRIDSTTAAMVVPASGLHLQYPTQMRQPLQMFMVNNMRGGGDGGAGASSYAPPPGAAPMDYENRSYNNYVG